MIIQDTNDNAPMVVSGSNKNLFVGSWSTVGSVVDRILATDLDSGENGRVSYSISAGNEEGHFKLDSDSGELTVAKSVSFPEIFVLNVTVADHGSPVTLHTTVSVTVTSQSKLENHPKFLKSVYHVNVSEDLAIGNYVFSFSSSVIEYTSGKRF